MGEDTRKKEKAEGIEGRERERGGKRISSRAFPLIKASQLISSPHAEDSLAEVNWSPFSCVSNSLASHECLRRY